MRYLSRLASEQFPSIRSAPRSVEAYGASIPVPTDGWFTETNLATMPATQAITLDNWFPQPGWVELRRDRIEHCDTGTFEPVETIAPWNGQASKRLFAASGDRIFDVTTDVPSTEVAGLNSARWQTVNFATTGNTYLCMVNGVDDPRWFDGTSWFVPALVIAGGAFAINQIIGINASKNRLWYIFEGSATVGYGDLDSFQGDVSLFDLGPLFSRGGYLMAMASWSPDGGAGPDVYAAFISSEGQAAIYVGTDPDDPTQWSLKGVYNVGEPIGRRCLYEMGADVALICLDGVLPLSQAMIYEAASRQKISLTKNIQSAMNEAARLYRNNFGWQLISYSRGTRVYLNIPVAENVEQQQFVMNTLNGAWCRFTGIPANCWEIFNEDVFCGGNDGIVYEADRSGLYERTESIRFDMECAFNYFGNRGRNKKWTMVRPIYTTDGSVNPGIAVNTDFQRDAIISVPTSPATTGTSLWDSSIWDSGDVWDSGELRTITPWTAVTALGYCASIRLVVDLVHPEPNLRAGRWGVGHWGVARWGMTRDGAEVDLRVNGFDTTYERGGYV